eukprot:122171-Pelagomonas_calceolata.AAC.7
MTTCMPWGIHFRVCETPLCCSLVQASCIKAHAQWDRLESPLVCEQECEHSRFEVAFPKSVHAARLRRFFSAYQSCYSLLETWAIFLFGALPYAWRLSGTLLHQAATLMGPIFWPSSTQAVTNMLTEEGNTLSQCCQSAVFVLLLICECPGLQAP